MTLLKERKANCYIKPNRFKHDSGFRCFEVGYLELGDNNKVADKLVLGMYSDHIHQDYLAGIDLKHEHFKINMDLTLDGYIRIWSHDGIIAWEDGTTSHVVSSAELTLIEKRERNKQK